MLSGLRRIRWWGRSARSTLLGIFLISTSSGCCSETLQPRPQPPGGRPEALSVNQREWVVVDENVTMPYKDLREILANRRRWQAYAVAWEALDGSGE